jgi:hypothetical protein
MPASSPYLTDEIAFLAAMAVPRIALMVLNAIPCAFADVEGGSVRVAENVDLVFHLALTPNEI